VGRASRARGKVFGAESTVVEWPVASSASLRGHRYAAGDKGPLKEGRWFVTVINPALSGLTIRGNPYRQLRERSARSQPAIQPGAFGTGEVRMATPRYHFQPHRDFKPV
jgi:hypothetical protein